MEKNDDLDWSLPGFDDSRLFAGEVFEKQKLMSARRRPLTNSKLLVQLVVVPVEMLTRIFKEKLSNGGGYKLDIVRPKINVNKEPT